MAWITNGLPSFITAIVGPIFARNRNPSCQRSRTAQRRWADIGFSWLFDVRQSQVLLENVLSADLESASKQRDQFPWPLEPKWARYWRSLNSLSSMPGRCTPPRAYSGPWDIPHQLLTKQHFDECQSTQVTDQHSTSSTIQPPALLHSESVAKLLRTEHFNKNRSTQGHLKAIFKKNLMSKNILCCWFVLLWQSPSLTPTSDPHRPNSRIFYRVVQKPMSVKY